MLSLEDLPVRFLEIINSLKKCLEHLLIFVSDMRGEILNGQVEIYLLFLNRIVWSKSKDVLFVSELFLEVYQPNVVLDELNLLLERFLLSLGPNFVESFTHNSNEHVHADDEDQEGGHYEKAPHKDLVLPFAEPI